jgi:hypothetical protein
MNNISVGAFVSSKKAFNIEERVDQSSTGAWEQAEMECKSALTKASKGEKLRKLHKN